MTEQPRITTGTILRMAVGLIWIAGAIFNALWTLRQPELFGDQGFGRDASLPIYRWFFGEVVAQAPAFWTVLLIVGEATIGILTMSRGPLAKVGLWGSVAWSLWLFPMQWPYTIMMGPFALLPAWLLRDGDPRLSVLGVLGRVRHLPRGPRREPA